MNALNSKKNINWDLIVIDDPNFLPGMSIFELINLILKSINFRYVILDDIVGAAEEANYLAEREGIVFEIDDFLKKVVGVVQFDWGNFFLFKEYPKNWQLIDRDYPNLIRLSDTTIRAVDDQYLYIYTPYPEIVECINNHYVVESVKNDQLENLDFPD